MRTITLRIHITHISVLLQQSPSLHSEHYSSFLPSDVRMAQYESKAKTPKHDLVKEMADIFDVSTHALTIPDIDTYTGLMRTFFALKDMYGLKTNEMNGKVVLRLDKSNHSTYSSMDKILRA